MNHKRVLDQSEQVVKRFKTEVTRDQLIEYYHLQNLLLPLHDRKLILKWKDDDMNPYIITFQYQQAGCILSKSGSLRIKDELRMSHAKQITEAINRVLLVMKPLPCDIIVYRGFGRRSSEEQSVVFTATSFSEYEAKRFAHFDGAVRKIFVPQGTKVLSFLGGVENRYSDEEVKQMVDEYNNGDEDTIEIVKELITIDKEQEILLPPGSFVKMDESDVYKFTSHCE